MNLTCTGSNDNLTLIGMQFGGTSSQTSKLRTAILNVQNSTMAKTLTSNVYGVLFNGTGALTPSSFSFNSLKGSTISVYSNGQGNKRGILVSNSNQASTRDLNVYVAAPPDTDSTGSYIGVETNDPLNNTGSIQMRATTCGVVYPITGQTYTASDILQTTPPTIANPTYLASPGIQVGPGTDLVTKSAGSKGFSTYIYPTTLYYGLKGNITSAPSGGYLWPGTQAASAGVFPDPGLPAAYYRCQQPVLIAGLYCALNVAPGGATSITWTVRVTPVGGAITDTLFTVTLTGTLTTGTFYNSSYRCNTGDQIHVFVSYTGATAAHDMTVQVDLF